MKATLPQIVEAGSINHAKGNSPSTSSSEKPILAGNLSFTEVISASLGNAEKTGTVSENKIQSNNTEKTTGSTGDEQKSKKKRPGKKIVPFSAVAVDVKLKTETTNNKGSEKAKKVVQKTSPKKAKKVIPQAQITSENASKVQLTEKNIKKPSAKKGSNKPKEPHKTNGVKLQPHSNDKSGKTKQVKLKQGDKVSSKNEGHALELKTKNTSLKGKPITQKPTLAKPAPPDVSSNVHKEKPVISASKTQKSPEQYLGQKPLHHPAKTEIPSAAEFLPKEYKKSKGRQKNQQNKSSFSKSVQTVSTKDKQIAGAQSFNDIAGTPTSKKPSTAKAPIKLNLDRFSPTAQIKTEKDVTKNSKGGTKKSSQDAHFNSLKMTHFAAAAGRKAFGRQLAQIVSPQRFGQQMQSAMKQSTMWKHHRVMLKNGKSIHIAARNSSGILQLQLNAGSGQLARLLQQHLQEIQQHVQQQLNIDINLQLRNSDEQKQERQPGKQTNGHRDSRPGAREKVSAIEEDYKASLLQVRYFGFNRNEWTA